MYGTAKRDGPNNSLPLPRNLYGNERLNSQGLDLSNESTLQELQTVINNAAASPLHAVPLLATAAPTRNQLKTGEN